MLNTLLLVMGLGMGGIMSGTQPAHAADDPNQFLEEVEGEKALAWVRAHNDKSLPSLEKDARYAGIEKSAREVVLAKDRIPMPVYRAGKIYNFWQDEIHVRGLWRSTTLESYRSTEPKWETVIDLDELAKNENENWVWHGASCLPPKYDRCIISLSRGGKDASVNREFDMAKRQFVKGGFELAESKGSTSWVDQDHLLIGIDFGEGTMTDSGYPRIAKLWKRGTPLAQATQIFAGEKTDVSASGSAYDSPRGTRIILSRDLTFFTNQLSFWDAKRSQVVPIALPTDVQFAGIYSDPQHNDWMLIELRTDWENGGKKFGAGSLLGFKLDGLAPEKLPTPELIFAPDERSSISGLTYTVDALYVSVLENVQGRLYKFVHAGSTWKKTPIGLPAAGTVDLMPADHHGNVVLLSFEGFLKPSSVMSVDHHDQVQNLRSIPDRFDAKPYTVEQRESVSKDGTHIPYFIVHRKDLVLNGQNPTLLYGYGGFEVPMTPFYLGLAGKVWLDGGGVYVLSNIRGGGEFGPKWHQAAILENKQRSYDDFISIAEDLIARKVTSPKHLGIEGGSNGGLLMGATFTQRPELFNAVVCQVPLLDMLRYHHLLAGASWMAEYGNPDDPKMHDVIIKYSPYQNLKADVKYPEVFFETSTKDDRVHPGHARKMAAKMEAQGHPFYYFENIEGGHGAAANLEQRIHRVALEYTYLFRKLSGNS